MTHNILSHTSLELLRILDALPYNCGNIHSSDNICSMKGWSVIFFLLSSTHVIPPSLMVHGAPNPSTLLADGLLPTSPCWRQIH